MIHTTTPSLRSSPRLRWANWQRSCISQQYLTPAAAAQGYTVLRVPPQERDVFFDLASLLLAHGRCEIRMSPLLEDATTAPRVEEAQAAWHAWRVWTRRLTAYLERLSQGKEGIFPPVPEAFQGLLDILGEQG